MFSSWFTWKKGRIQYLGTRLLAVGEKILAFALGMDVVALSANP